MADNSISLKREDIDIKYKWATEDIYPSDEAWKSDSEKFAEYRERILALKGKIGESAENLLACMKLNDECMLYLEYLNLYAHLKKDENTRNSVYQNLDSRATSIIIDLESASSFFTPEILAIPEDKLTKWLEECPELRAYKRALDKIIQQKPHVLSEAEEALLAAAGEMANAPENISSMFRNADLKFPDALDSEGRSYKVTQASFVPLMENRDETLRKSAFMSVYNTHESNKNLSAAMLDAQVRQLMFFANARKFDNTMSASLFGNEVPVSVYMNLIKSVHENLEAMYKYVRLRKKLMDKAELHMYDLYTPIVKTEEIKIDFEQAKLNVVEGLQALGQEYIDILKEGFDNRWIDAFENEGKRGGAYSAGGFPHPYVLLNYKETLDNEFTLAHEMGHSIHTYLSIKNQPITYANYVIFVAEVASTCNEALLMQHLLKNTSNKTERAYLINSFLEQFRTTLYRQTMFAEFEMLINQEVENGGSLTADTLCKIYYELNTKYYGSDMTVDSEIAYEWARIPHFYYNFYVFQYATGFSAAIALSRRILKEGEPAVRDYLRFLSGGASEDPISLLKKAGVDMTTSQPVDEALKMFDELIDELDELTSED